MATDRVKHLISLKPLIPGDVHVVDPTNTFVEDLNRADLPTAVARDRFVTLLHGGKQFAPESFSVFTDNFDPLSPDSGYYWAEPESPTEAQETFGALRPQTQCTAASLQPPPMDEAQAPLVRVPETTVVVSQRPNVATQTEPSEAEGAASRPNTSAPASQPRRTAGTTEPVPRRPRTLPRSAEVRPSLSARTTPAPLLTVPVPAVAAPAPAPAPPVTDPLVLAVLDRLQREMEAQRADNAAVRAELHQVRVEASSRRVGGQNDRLADSRLLPRLPYSWQEVAAKWPWEHIWNGLANPSFDSLVFMVPKAVFSTLLNVLDVLFSVVGYLNFSGALGMLNLLSRNGMPRMF